MEKKEFCKVTVHWENKSTGKTDTRILIFRSDRLDVAVLKGQIRVERTVHFLDIRRLETGEENRVTLTLNGGEALNFACTLDADLMRIVSHLVASLQFHLPQLRSAQTKLIDLHLPPAWDLEAMVSNHLTELGRPPNSDKCGHFSSAYEFFCKYAGAEVRDEIKWDVETIYFSQGSRAFALSDFGHFTPTDFAMILAALTFNDYFTVLNADGVKFSPQMARFLEQLLTYNSTFVEIHLSNCGLKLDSVKAIASAIETNSRCRIKVLDLSSNLFNEDKVVERLSSLLSRLSGNLERLNISNCGLTAKALNKLSECLSQGQGAPPLRQLVVDGNEQKGENSTMVQKCIAKATNLEHLSCVGCDFNLESFAPALYRGLTQCVTYLDLSGNQFSSQRRPSRPKEQPTVSKDWGQLFARSLRLKTVRLNNCKLPPQAVSDLLSGLGSNQDLNGVILEMAGNELGLAGAQVLCSCLKSCSIKCLESLDISDNGFDTELNRVVDAVCGSSVRHLAVGGNNFRLKDAGIVEEFAEHVTDSKCTLESLSVRDAKLKERITFLLNSVGQCKNLTRLDITGNGMGGLGAKFLAKSLYLNSSLTEVQLDDNQIGLSGLKDIAEALQFNSSLRSLPVPAGDVARMISENSSAAEVQAVLAAMQLGLLKNHSATYQVTGRDYRLQSELGNYAFSLDHMAGRLDLSLKNLGPCDPTSDPEAAECERQCRAAMQDALSARFLLTGLSSVADTRQVEATVRCLRDQLPQPLLTAATEDLTRTQEAMMEFLAKECPNAFKAEPALAKTLRSRLTSEQSQVTEGCVQGLLEKSAGASLASKLSALQLNSALLMNDCMQEVIAHNLQEAEQALSKLMRSKMLQPSLRRADSQRTPTAAAEPSQAPAQLQPPAPLQSRRGNNRPISVFGKKLKGDAGGGSKMQVVVDIGQDENDSNGSPRPLPQPLPRRPTGDRTRRLPTRQATTDTTAAEGPNHKSSSEEEDNIYTDVDVAADAEPVFEPCDDDSAVRSAEKPAPAACAPKKLPPGAVSVMGLGGPAPPRLLRTLPPPLASQGELPTRSILRQTQVSETDGRPESTACSGPAASKQTSAPPAPTKPKPKLKPLAMKDSTKAVSDAQSSFDAAASSVADVPANPEVETEVNSETEPKSDEQSDGQKPETGSAELN